MMRNLLLAFLLPALLALVGCTSKGGVPSQGHLFGGAQGLPGALVSLTDPTTGQVSVIDDAGNLHVLANGVTLTLGDASISVNAASSTTVANDASNPVPVLQASPWVVGLDGGVINAVQSGLWSSNVYIVDAGPLNGLSVTTNGLVWIVDAGPATGNTGGAVPVQALYCGGNQGGTLVGFPAGNATAPFRIDPTGTTTQPVSGTLTCNAGSGTFTISGAVTEGTSPWVVSAAADSGAFPVSVGPTVNAIILNDAGNQIPVTIGAGSSVTISGNCTAPTPFGQNNVLAGLVQATPGAVCSVVLTNRGTGQPYICLQNQGTADAAAPCVPIPLPATQQATSTQPGIVAYDDIFRLGGWYFDAGIAFCISTDQTNCITTGEDAGSFAIIVGHQ